MTWFHQEGPKGDIALSSRVRLARNLRNIPFPGTVKTVAGERTSDGHGHAWLNNVSDILTGAGGGSVFAEQPVDTPLKARSLIEQHAISPEFAQLERPHKLVRNNDGSVSVMLGEEDHIRLQTFAPGLDLTSCLREAMKLDDLLDEQLSYAFSETLGFLTSCPTNLGTGMRASVMLHLPALTRTGILRSIVNSAGQMGFTVRGMYGEGSQATGDLYQLSNQVGIGFSENELAERMTEAARRIIASERAARELMRQKSGSQTLDFIWRAYGLLTHARLLTLEEAMQQLGLIRVGVAMGDITHVSIPTINKLLIDVQTATLMLEHGVTQEECAEKRASVVREALRKGVE